MQLVIDSNILFAAIIRDSTARRLLLTIDEELILPANVFEEINRHLDEICEKSGLSKHEALELLAYLTKKTIVVPEKDLLPYREQATVIIKNIDIDDVLFIACALKYPNSVLWSDDKRLKKQTSVAVMSTSEMLESAKHMNT